MVCIVGVALLGWAGATFLLTRSYGEMRDITLASVLLFAPLAIACVLGASTRTPFGDLEKTAARSLFVLRFLHLSGLLAWSLLALSLSTTTWGLPHAELILTRNLLGITGLTFLTAYLLSSELSWTIPLVYIALVQLTGRNSDGTLAPWAWPMQPVTHEISWVLALILFAVGLIVVCFFGSNSLPEKT